MKTVAQLLVSVPGLHWREEDAVAIGTRRRSGLGHPLERIRRGNVPSARRYLSVEQVRHARLSFRLVTLIPIKFYTCVEPRALFSENKEISLRT